MATIMTKSLASRVPIELYDEITKEAGVAGQTVSDYLIPIIINRNKLVDLNLKLKDAESRFNLSERRRAESDSNVVELESTIRSNESRRKYALSKLTNYLEQSKGIKPEVVAEIWNTWY